jgi:L-cysteine:1D-myo-inositol 2-amino-2-deoxy-alpha-D-glucopyranoside ligase
MRLHNSLTGEIERFRPRSGKPVSVYVCGITPYDTTHLGHAFTYVTFDLLIRHFEAVHAWPVRYVQNLTDVDDDVLRRAAETGDDWRDLGRTWTERFRHDMAALNVRPPDAFPGASAYVGSIVDDVQQLLASGVAYERSGSVYYDTQSDQTFGALAEMTRAEMLKVANERGNDPDDPNKKDPLDFVLWQAAQQGEPAWDSPWGPGRPGWHMECSTMARRLLGDTIDIHGGGRDLAFPHHCCEIAQSGSETQSGVLARFWMHVAMVHMDGEKMSKSLGNLVLISDLLQEHEPDSIRLYLARHHYRSEWEWDPQSLSETDAWIRTLHAAVARAPGPRDGPAMEPAKYGPRFTAAMDDDLDTPAAVDVVMSLADDVLAAPAHLNTAAAQDVLRALAGRVLGLWLQPYESVPPERRSAAQWPVPDTAGPDITAYAT